MWCEYIDGFGVCMGSRNQWTIMYFHPGAPINTIQTSEKKRKTGEPCLYVKVRRIILRENEDVSCKVGLSRMGAVSFLTRQLLCNKVQ